MTICPVCGTEFEIKKLKGPSSQARRYYFGVVVKAISEHTGYERDETHELLAMRFLRVADDPVTGSPRRQRIPQVQSPEFAEYVDRCKRFAAIELHIVIPDPLEPPAEWRAQRPA